MLSAKNRIRMIVGLIALVSWGASLLSLVAINRMIYRTRMIIRKDAAIVELGERINVGMLEARRDEKNFIIYFDSTYLVKNRERIGYIVQNIQQNRDIADIYHETLDSLEIMIDRYSRLTTQLSRTYQEDPRALYRLQEQVRDYEKELRGLVQKRKLDVNDMPSWGVDFSVPLLSAAMKVSSDQARLFTDLRETSARVQDLAQRISMQAREMLARDASMSVEYGLRAQKWIFLALILAGLALSALIVIVPNRIFLRFHRLSRALKAIGRGETDIRLPVGQHLDEVSELAESFQEAIEKLNQFNRMKTEKIIEIERNLRKIIDEVDESIFILSPELKITHLNRPAQKMFKITSDVVQNPLKQVSFLWEQVGEQLENIEKNGRSEAQIKAHKHDLKKHQVLMMPIIGLAKRLESVVIFIR
ncbi:HAMP domain-containing protein [bacterium]|nr:HAMP domain-containing protein [bacterium]